MDILAARKKAAELAAKKKQQEAEKQKHLAAEPEPETPQPEPADGHIPVPDPDAAGSTASPPVSVSSPEPEPITEGQAEVVEEEQAQELEMLSFKIGQEEYALMVGDVKEVLKNRDLTPVPNAPDYILGITSLRGLILPVIDLCKRLGVPSAVRDEKSRILVAAVNDEHAGILVDRVTGVVRIHPDSVRPAPETIEKGAELLQGIARKDDKLYILLDREKALGA